MVEKLLHMSRCRWSREPCSSKNGRHWSGGALPLLRAVAHALCDL